MNNENKLYDGNDPNPVQVADVIKSGGFRSCRGCSEQILSNVEKCPYCGTQKRKNINLK